MRYIVFFLFCCLSVSSQSKLTDKVIKVSDGDTFTILNEKKEVIRIRIYGIDAPERGQAYSEKSRLFLAKMIVGKVVLLEIKNTDKYGRKIAKVKTDSINDVGLEMLKAGLAWHYSYFDKTETYIQAEQKARKNKNGLWAEKNPINPYEYRKIKRNKF